MDVDKFIPAKKKRTVTYADIFLKKGIYNENQRTTKKELEMKYLNSNDRNWRRMSVEDY